MLEKTTVQGLFVGTPSELPNGQMSAIRKKSVSTIEVLKERIVGDSVFAEKYHGGQMRVLHQFSRVGYEHFKKCFSEIEERFIPGSFGENLFTPELTEADLCIGDIFNLGNIKVQLTVPRRPCATINATYEDNRVLKEVLSSYHVGWFYQILEEGKVSVGDELSLIERPNPDLKILDLMELGYGKNPFKDLELVKKVNATGLMDKGWAPKIEKALLQNE